MKVKKIMLFLSDVSIVFLIFRIIIVVTDYRYLEEIIDPIDRIPAIETMISIIIINFLLNFISYIVSKNNVGKTLFLRSLINLFLSILVIGIFIFYWLVVEGGM